MNTKILKIIRSKFKKKKTVISSWSQISNPNLVEILCDKNFDCLTFDFEHGLFNISDLPNLLRVAEINKKASLVRLPNKNIEICRQVLDAGVDGIIIPNIKNEVELKKIIKINLLPPKGKRGVGFSRSNKFGKEFKKYINSKAQPLIIAMIEDIEAIKNLRKILQVENLDGILIGPYDLSASMGIPGKFENREFKKNINLIKSECKNYKISYGLHLIDPNYSKLKKLIKEGYNFVPYSTDTFIINNAVKNLFRK
ncbi:MAG: hypothetical protein CBC82_07025 [Cellvibrionales bacterium TMED122]|nr:MAG: hypothetical protein CBC82_07025 [Cellvibrionales bacterium TMED122]|tara:strand:- start:7668 stop:8429 length:762 start_codon:yes stop_codon:yes gene_type:complete